MGVNKYNAHGRTFWMVDEWLELPDGQRVRFRQRGIPTKELAVTLVAKRRTEAFEGRYFDRVKPSRLTVAQAWELFWPVVERDCRAWRTEKGRAAHLVRLLGKKQAAGLNQRDVDCYRTRRLGETTQRGGPPASATLDHEVELLKRTLGYAVKCGELAANPLASVKLLRKPNVRKTVVDEGLFAKLLEAAEPALMPILLVAYDTGMRKTEILRLRWDQVDLRTGSIELAPQDTKTARGRTVYLTGRVLEALQKLPRHLRSKHVFVNPDTGECWKDIRKLFRRACRKVGLTDVWFHDLRRSFVTNARRRGVPESVVMRMSGHRTRAVFDRYNIVNDDDVRMAVRQIEAGCSQDLATRGSREDGFGQDLVKVANSGPQTTKPPSAKHR